MSRGEAKTGHWELAICLAVPVVVIVLMCLSGFMYGRKQERILAQRTGLIKLIPVLEEKVCAAQKALKPFVAPGGDKDMAANLSLRVSDAAQKYGFVIRSSNVEKQVGPDAGAWTDYKLTVSGEGSLTSLIAMLDYLGQPPSRFCAVHVSLRTIQLVPETMSSADLVLVTRVVAERNGENGAGLAGNTTQIKAEAIGVNLEKATDGVMSWLAEPVTPLSLKKLQGSAINVASEAAQSEPSITELFRLTGVVRDGKHPVIMTDRGVFGVGDEVGGFRVETIGEDKVTVVSRGGRRETVQLYKNGGGM
jgi:hypothetical protein